MSKFVLKDTSIPMSFTTMMGTLAERVWEPSDTPSFYDVLFTGFAEFLGTNKSKSGKICIKVQDTKGPVKFGAVVGYMPNEGEEDGVGNWFLTSSFDEKDLEGCIKDYTICDTEWQRLIENVAFNLERMQFDRPQTLHTACLIAVDCIKEWLDQNAKEGEEVILEHEGYFTASVAVENGEKVMSIVLDGAMKRLIKDDAAIEG